MKFKLNEDLKPGEFVCPRCHEYVINENERFHPCKKEGERFALPTLYIPNAGRLTANADPAYRKHAGSRSLVKVMKARVKANRFKWATTPFQNIPF